MFLIQSAFANDCSTVNLVSQKDSPFNKIPVYDQDGIGICFAYAASQLADYHLIKNGSPARTIHPLWGALKYAELKQKERISAGITFKTLNEIIRKGNCDYSLISGALSSWARKARASEAEVMGLIEVYATKLKAVTSFKGEALKEDEIENLINESISAQEPYCSSNANLKQLVPQLKELSVLGSREVFTKLIFPSCQNKTYKPSLPSPRNYVASKNENLVPAISGKLKNLNTPVSITYCSKLLFEDSYKGKLSDDSCGPHESLIVGMKSDGKSCKMLLRNTWGNGFGKSTKKWKCFCRHKKTNAFVDDCTYEKHNNGQFSVEGCWIDSDAIAKNTFEMTWFENKKK